MKPHSRKRNRRRKSTKKAGVKSKTFPYFCRFYAMMGKSVFFCGIEGCKVMRSKILAILWSCFFCLAVHNSCVSSDNSDIAKELESMEHGIPMPYHKALDKKVTQLAKKQLPETFKVHESFIDSMLLVHNMPTELKYLPYALSGMKAGYQWQDRCGYWALPSLVGMHYGLRVDGYRDERLSVEASTVAALAYLDDLYKKYNDWWYSILAYTNSPTSLSHATIHYGSEPALWDFYEQQMMPDTEVIADFIACVYLGDQNKLSFTAKAVEPSVIKMVEPKKEVKPVESVETQQVTVSNMSGSTTNTGTVDEQAPKKQAPSTASETLKYKVRRGDTLTKIASKHHVTVKNLMKWNNLKNDRIREGQTLIIKK